MLDGIRHLPDEAGDFTKIAGRLIAHFPEIAQLVGKGIAARDQFLRNVVDALVLADGVD
jgi:hypothetical protein